MNWFSVSEYIGNKCCFERQRYGKCGCQAKGKRNKNPCGHAANLKAACERIGDGLPSGVSLDEIYTWLRKHTCYESQRGGLCNHRSCERGEKLIAFVKEQINQKTAA